MADTAAALVIQLSADLKAFRAEMRNATGVFDTEARKIERRQAAMRKKLEQSFSFGGVRGMLAGAGVALSTREVLRYADAWTAASNRIRASGTAFEATGARMAKLADLAVETRADLGQTVNAFSRLRMFTPNMGEDQAMKIVKTMNQAFVVGGAQGSERAAATLQLTQALSSGKLQGDELRSIRETAPLVAQAIADAMGTSIGGLKALGAEGKLTTEVILKAINAAGPKIAEMYAKTQSTVADSLTNLETRFTQFVGKLSENGSMAVIAGGINSVSKNLDLLADALIVVTAALGAAGIVRGINASITAFGALVTIIKSATAANQSLTLALLRNPWVAAAVAVAAVTTALIVYSNRQIDSKKATEDAAAANKYYNDQVKIAVDYNGKLSSQIADTTRARLLDAKATLEQAVAQERANMESERARLGARGFPAVDGGEWQKGYLSRIETAQKELSKIDASLADNAKRTPNAIDIVRGDISSKYATEAADARTAALQATKAGKIQLENERYAKAMADINATKPGTKSAQDTLDRELKAKKAAYDNAVWLIDKEENLGADEKNQKKRTALLIYQMEADSLKRSASSWDGYAAAVKNATDAHELNLKSIEGEGSSGGTKGPSASSIESLAQRRKVALEKSKADFAAANTDLVRAQQEANETIGKRSAEFDAIRRASIEAQAKAEIDEINARTAVELANLGKMAKGWSDYAKVRANVEAAGKARIDAVTAKANADLYQIGSGPLMAQTETDATAQIQRYKDQVANIGLTAGELARAEFEQQAWNRAAEEGKTLTEKEKARIRELASEVGAAAQQWSDVAEQQMRAVQISDDFRDTLAEIVVNFDNAKSALASFLQMLAKMAAMEGIEAIFGKKGTVIGGGGTGGGNNGTGGLLSAAWGGVKDILGFADGTNYAPGGVSLVGEKGPELVNLPRGSKVTPTAPTMAALRTSNRNSSYNNYGGNIIVAGDTDNRSLRMMQAMLAQRDAQYESQWLAANQKYNRNK